MKKHSFLFAVFLIALITSLYGQGHLRLHTAIKTGTLKLNPATRTPPAKSEIDIKDDGKTVTIRSNGIPEHQVGQFPNRGNPNVIRPQTHVANIPSDPKPAEKITYMHAIPPGPHVFGITLDGVFLEPGAGEFWQGNTYWQYEPLNGAIDLGLDANHAHVQPTGMYHYHGMPTGLMKRLGFEDGKHSPLVGWAADGFPIYVRFGYTDPEDPDSGVTDLKPSYQLMEGDRPDGKGQPGGKYDGTFIRDYDFFPGSGDLDECSGRFCITPEFPDGTYAYFMTEAWPVIPRGFRGTPTNLKFGGGQPGGGHRGPGKGRKGFPRPPRRF